MKVSFFKSVGTTRKSWRYVGTSELHGDLGHSAADGMGRCPETDDGSVLPFQPTPSGSKAARAMQESTYRPLPKPYDRLAKDAPNILIILIDDAGPALPDTYGGDIHTPALSKLAEEGISFDRFHTTAMCSRPVRRRSLGAIIIGSAPA